MSRGGLPEPQGASSSQRKSEEKGGELAFFVHLESLGYPVISLVQSITNPFLDLLALAATFLGTEAFFLFFVPFYYWCVDKRQGVRLALVFLFSVYINNFLKELFRAPRPDPSLVRVLWASSGGGYSFPSGHAQNAVVFWGWLGRRLPWRRRPGILATLVLAISFSRIYMGLHFLHDVVGGWILGALLLATLVLVDRRVSRDPKGWEGKIVPWLGVFLPLFLVGLSTNKVQAMVAGAILGFCAGYMAESRYIGFSPRCPWREQVVKLVIGVGIGGMLGFFLKWTFPRGPEWDFITYAILGSWVSLGLPFLHRKVFSLKESSIADS